eukprot:1107804-Amorphochlora_amoeboformis.AAC.1
MGDMKDNAPVAPYLRKICGESWTHLVDPTCKALDFIGIRTIGQLRKNLATDKARISRVSMLLPRLYQNFHRIIRYCYMPHHRYWHLLVFRSLYIFGFKTFSKIRYRLLEEIEQKTTKKMMLHLRKLSMTFNGVYVDKVEAKSEEAKKGIKKGWKS